MGELPRVYIETTVISYLTARPSSDLVVAAHQKISKDWWESRREHFDLFVSELVHREVQAGDPNAAEMRLATISDLALLTIDDSAIRLAESLALELRLPDRASADALHIAIAVIHGMSYLVTWNCRHIANAQHRHLLMSAPGMNPVRR